MGITRGSTRLLLEEGRRRAFEGSVLQLGKMFVFLTEDELKTWAKAHGFPLNATEFQLSHDPVLAAHGCIDDRTFFSRLGFGEVLSLDAAPWEGADVIADLNKPVPEELHGRFDLVFEGGTLQSVFHLPNALSNIHRLLKPGGRIVHAMTPSHNQVDLGFFMFSPTYFHDFYTANGWKLETMLLCEHLSYWVEGKLETGPWDIYQYETGCLDHLSYGRYGSRQLTLFVVATKTDETTVDRVPQQGYYEALWKEDPAEREAELERRARRIRSRRWLYDSRPFHAYRRLSEHLRRLVWPRRMPTRVARY
ncbi:MAG: class I SAM-dependent methyltransferase [Acidobacteriota bacterium]